MSFARMLVKLSCWLVTPTVTVQQQLLQFYFHASVFFTRRCVRVCVLVCVCEYAHWIINNDYSKKKSLYFEK